MLPRTLVFALWCSAAASSAAPGDDYVELLQRGTANLDDISSHENDEDSDVDLDDDANNEEEENTDEENDMDLDDAANMTGKCQKWCAKRYEKFAKQGKQAKLVATCRKKGCAGCDMCGPEPTPQPTPAPTPEPTPQPTAAVQVKTANWWSSFDRKGWSTTPGGFTGIFRNDCNALYCIEEIHYADFPLGECYEANWWSSFDRKGWSTCNDGFYITGLYRNDCNSLYCIEAAKCCKKRSANSYPSSCYNANWWHSFDRKGWSDCKSGYSIAGLYRNDCNSLYCIEEVKCCPY